MILKETGLIILTFDNANLADKLKEDYEIILITKYIKSPTQCKNCHRFGHIGKWGKNAKSCSSSCKDIHNNLENNEKCN